MYKLYNGKNKNNITVTGDDYYSENKTFMLRKLINELPEGMAIVDSFDSVTFIQECESLTFYKEVFDPKYLINTQMDNPWDWIWTELFNKVGHSNIKQQPLETFSEVKHTLHDALHVLPHYKEALLTFALNDYLDNNLYVKNKFYHYMKKMLFKYNDILLSKNSQKGKHIIQTLNSNHIYLNNLDVQSANQYINHLLKYDCYNDHKFNDAEDFNKDKIDHIFTVDHIILLHHKGIITDKEINTITHYSFNPEKIFNKIIKYYSNSKYITDYLSNKIYLNNFVYDLTNYYIFSIDYNDKIWDNDINDYKYYISVIKLIKETDKYIMRKHYEED